MGAATVFAVAAWLGLAIVAIVAIVLVLPLRLEMQLRAGPDWDATTTLRPFGRFGPPIRMHRNPRPTAADRAPRDKSRKRSRGGSVRMHRFSAALRLLTDILSRIHVDRLSVRAQIGCEDPADTGSLYGGVVCVGQAARGVAGADIHIVPVFDRPVLDLAADLSLTTRLVTFLGPLLRFGWAFFGGGR